MAGARAMPGSHACAEERYREADQISLESRAAFGEDESHARGQAGVKWGVRPAEQPRPAHCIHPRSWCQLSGGCL